MRTFVPEERTREIQLTGMPLGSFRRRLAAFFIDSSIIAAMFIPLSVWVAKLLGELGFLDLSNDYNLELDFGNLYSVLLFAIYFSLSHYFLKGQTLGKKILGLRVLSLDHERLGFWHCVERALGYGASALEGGFGFFQVIWKPDRRATHDRIANTIVVREKRNSTHIDPPSASE